MTPLLPLSLSSAAVLQDQGTDLDWSRLDAHALEYGLAATERLLHDVAVELRLRDPIDAARSVARLLDVAENIATLKAMQDEIAVEVRALEPGALTRAIAEVLLGRPMNSP